MENRQKRGFSQFKKNYDPQPTSGHFKILYFDSASNDTVRARPRGRIKNLPRIVTISLMYEITHIAVARYYVDGVPRTAQRNTLRLLGALASSRTQKPHFVFFVAK